MLLHHGMTVPASADEVWQALGEIEGIAPCLPGASVDRVDGDTVYGSMTVKVGPITVAYRGRAVIDERDDTSHRMVVHASGREQRGAGTAQATLVVELHEQPSGATEVDVDTDLIVTGRPAQFGRGIMADVGDRVIAEFTDRLSARMAASVPTTSSAEEAVTADTMPVPQAGRDEPLDLGPILVPVLRRAGALAVIALSLTFLARMIRRWSRRGSSPTGGGSPSPWPDRS